MDADRFDRIPKVELHCHVEGTVRPATVVELARKAELLPDSRATVIGHNIGWEMASPAR